MKFEVEILTAEADRLLRLLPEKYARPAAARATDRATKSTAALATTIVKDELGIKPTELRKRGFVTTTKARSSDGAAVKVLGRGAPIEIFKSFTISAARGASARVAGAAARLRHAFRFPGRGGQIIVQRAREGGKPVGRGPVRRIFGPAPASVIGQQRNLLRLELHAMSRFFVEFARDFNYRINRDAIRASQALPRSQKAQLKAAGLSGLARFVPK